MNTAQAIRDHLSSLSPQLCEVEDESHRHIGHAGAGAGGHFRLTIISTAFAGHNSLARHRMIHTHLAPLMQGAIHALSITALTPEEAS